MAARHSTVAAAVEYVNSRARAGEAQPRSSRRLTVLAAARQAAAAGAAKGFVPSGPRGKGVGCEDEEQGILHAEAAEGGAKLFIALLAAGFVIGPGGTSVREVSKQTGADIRSWNDTWAHQGRRRQVRCLVLEGKRRAVVQALEVITEAVDRYKELCEGKYAGHVVDRCQQIRGCSFYYQPPPRAAVPYAAALKSHGDKSRGPVKVVDMELGEEAGCGWEDEEGEKENRPISAGEAGALQAKQALLAVPNLALPAEALFSSAPSLPGAPFLSSAAAGLSSGLLGPTATSGAVQEAAGNLLAALSSGAPLGLGASQATPLRLGAGQLLTADSHLQLTPVAPPPPASAAQPCALQRAPAGDLDQLVPAQDLERISYAACQPRYSLFGAGPPLGAHLLPGGATAGAEQQHALPTPGPCPLGTEDMLLACGFPSFTSFAQQSPYFPQAAALFPQPPAGPAQLGPSSPWLPPASTQPVNYGAAAPPPFHPLPAGPGPFHPMPLQ